MLVFRYDGLVCIKLCKLHKMWQSLICHTVLMDYHVQYGPLSPKEASYVLFVYTCIDVISSNISADAEICKFLA